MQRGDIRRDDYVSSFRASGAPPILDQPPLPRLREETPLSLQDQAPSVQAPRRSASPPPVTDPLPDATTVPDVAPSRLTDWTPMQPSQRLKPKADGTWMVFLFGFVIILIAFSAFWSNIHPSPNAALVRAAYDGDLAQAADAISKGADVNNGCGCRQSPLQTASANGHVAVASLLASEGAAIDAVDKDGESALSLAVDHRHAAVAAVLADNGANVNQSDPSGGPVLLAAVRHRDADMAQTLLTHNADPNRSDVFGRTPLMEAVRVGSLPMVEMLIGHKAAVNARSRTGITAYSAALREQRMDIVGVLRKAGAVMMSHPGPHTTPPKAV